MNRIPMNAAALSILLIALPLGSGAQAPVPSAPPSGTAAAPPQLEQKPPARPRSDAPVDADARHCLDLASDREVILCAEKFRARKAKG